MTLLPDQLQSQLFSFLNNSKRPLIVVIGPTALGKTAFSLELAKAMNNTGESQKRQMKQGRQKISILKGGISFDSFSSPASFASFVEIINADSRQLYKHLDIGTAKIRPEDMRGMPHHLIDVLDPKEEVTAAWYKKEAERIIKEIQERGNVPMLVGGSMLYISAIIDGLDFPAGSDPVLRKKLEEEYDRDAGKSLHKRLEEIDAEAAAVIPVQNKPYIVRAMQLYESTGKRPTAIKTSSQSPYDLFVIGIERSRDDIVKRINERTKVLIESGWIEEVRSLVEKGYGPKDPGMKSHGYQEIMAFLRGEIPDKKILAELIAAKTRKYAKRQMTWWKNDPRIHWITPSI